MGIAVWSISRINLDTKQADTMTETQKNNPLHGVTLEQILTALVESYGWEQLGKLIPIRCFNQDPSIKSSLNFLRKTEWARLKVEQLYLKQLRKTKGQR